MYCAPSKDSDPHSLIRAFAVRLKKTTTLPPLLSTEHPAMFIFHAGWSQFPLAHISEKALSHTLLHMEFAVSNKTVSSGICGQRRPRSVCVSAQSNQGLHYPLTESLDTIKCINLEKMSGYESAHARNESESVHFAHVRRYIFAGRGPNENLSSHRANDFLNQLFQNEMERFY